MGYLIATAEEKNIRVIVSNDEHIEKIALKYGLSVYNPLPKYIIERMR